MFTQIYSISFWNSTWTTLCPLLHIVNGRCHPTTDTWWVPIHQIGALLMKRIQLILNDTSTRVGCFPLFCGAGSFVRPLNFLYSRSPSSICAELQGEWVFNHNWTTDKAVCILRGCSSTVESRSSSVLYLASRQHIWNQTILHPRTPATMVLASHEFTVCCSLFMTV